jgi:hypothetical protein
MLGVLETKDSQNHFVGKVINKGENKRVDGGNH